MKRLALRLLRDERAAAAVEMALVIPLLVIFTFGPLEVGNYFMDEHTLVKGVRDGALYAAHQDITNYPCNTSSPPQTVIDNTKAIVRTGQLSGGTDRIANWASGSTSFTVTYSCVTSAGGTNLSGIYKINAGGNVPVVTVTASVPYATLFRFIGVSQSSLTLTATQQATVMGI